MKVKDILKDGSKWLPGRDYETKTPLVSVLLPTFRRAKSGLFEAAVRSVLDQSFKDLELIIIDDASTDGTADLIRYFMETDPRVSCIRHTYNIGLPAISEYEGYMKARGEYIAFIFDDNEWDREYIAKTIPCMIRNEVKASYGIVKSYYTEDNFIELGRANDVIGVGMHSLPLTNHIANGGVILTREVIENVGLYDPHLTMVRLCDWNLWKRIFSRYEFFATGIFSGIEKGASQSDSLGNTLKCDQWAVYEREQSQDKGKMLPANYPEIDVTEVAGNNTESYVQCVTTMYNSFSKKKWYKKCDITGGSIRQNTRKRVLILCASADASLSLSFGRLLMEKWGCIMRVGDPGIPDYELVQADAVIFFRNLIAFNNHKKLCDKLGIPTIYYLDDNFIELARTNKQDNEIQKLARILKSGYMLSMDQVITPSRPLKEYFDNINLNEHVTVLDPCIDETRISDVRAPGDDEPVTVAFMGGKFRDVLFLNTVMPAVAGAAQHRKIRVLYPSRINLVQYEKISNLELIPIEFCLSLELSMIRYGKYHPDILLHCGPDIQNNTYKTENALINAVQLGAILVASAVAPYKALSDAQKCCICVNNTVAEWRDAIEEIIAQKKNTAGIYQRAKSYCLNRYSIEHAIKTLEQSFKDIKPSGTYEIIQRLKEALFDRLYVGTMTAPLEQISGKVTKSLTEVPLSFTGGIHGSKSYKITCKPQTFSELGICFSSYGNACGKIRVGIYCDEGQLRECVLAMDEYVHDNWTYMEFDPIENAAGKVFTVKIDFEYDDGSALVGVFEDATKRTFLYRVLNKLGWTLPVKDLLFTDCR